VVKREQKQGESPLTHLSTLLRNGPERGLIPPQRAGRHKPNSETGIIEKRRAVCAEVFPLSLTNLREREASLHNRIPSYSSGRREASLRIRTPSS